MKKTLLILLCMTALAASAQQFRYGFSIAPAKTILNIESDMYDPAESYRGIQYGLLLDQTFLKGEYIALTFGLNLNYTNSGFSTLQEKPNDDDKYWEVKTRYIEIPLTLRLRTPQFGAFTVYGEVGGSYAKATRAVGDYELNGLRLDSDFDFFDKGNSNGITYNTSNASMILGGGVEIAITKTASIMVGIFHAKGLQNVYEDNNADSNLFLNQTGLKIAGLF